MGIGSVNDYGFIHNYKVPSIPEVRLEEVKAQNPQMEEEQVMPAADIPEKALAPVPARKDAELEDISLTFNKQEGFGYLGQDSDVHSLDMEKAISDMKKDQVLQQYQYFVGRSKNLVTENADGAVFTKF